MLVVQPVILNFLSSNTTVVYIDSDSGAEGFQKIRGEKFERLSGFTLDVENSEISLKDQVFARLRP